MIFNIFYFIILGGIYGPRFNWKMWLLYQEIVEVAYLNMMRGIALQEIAFENKKLHTMDIVINFLVMKLLLYLSQLF